MIGQTWTLDGQADVVITELGLEPNSRLIHRLEVSGRDGQVKTIPLGEFLSRAVYREG
jgi:hypothetical protein